MRDWLALSTDYTIAKSLRTFRCRVPGLVSDFSQELMEDGGPATSAPNGTVQTVLRLTGTRQVNVVTASK